MQAKIYEYLANAKNPAQIIIFDDFASASSAYGAACFAGFECFVLPDFVATNGDDLRSFYTELLKISEILSKYYKSNNAKKILLSPLSTINHKLPAKKHLKEFCLKKNEKININELKEQLSCFGYSFVDIVQSKAEASFRGEIIDIFNVASKQPVRILLDFDTIESIKFFDEASQKSSVDELDSIYITPFVAALSKKEFDKISANIANLQSNLISNDINAFGLWYIDDLVDYIKEFNCILAITNEENLQENLKNIPKIPQAKFYKDLEIVPNSSFFAYHKDKKITLLSSNESSVRALELDDYININVILSPLWLNIASDDEIIVSLNKPTAKTRVKKASIIIDELEKGDLVVHEDYGIGRFVGLEQACVLGVKQEFVVILYQGGDRLLLPAQNLALIDKYIANSGFIAQLDRLGKTTFAKIKQRVKEKLFVIANAIIELAAKRELITAAKFSIDKEYEKFRQSAGFSYTLDQETALKAIISDLTSTMVMDRLLSGDVGFGKTEVAMNAIYLCVRSGYQALFFVPTTLLCAQHFNTLKSRFEKFEILVYRIDRFTSSAHKNEAKMALQNGKAVVVVGTHSLLNIKASKLGLMVIDEEHKFGVKQKEKLKEISINSHILSMSATPIPRSLNMALSQVKSYSTLTTPPLDRLDVRTFVKKWDSSVIKEGILRELRRKGQVFFVHNLIADLERVKRELLAIIDGLRILILHGRIDAKTSEEEMLKFSQGEYDLLLCTSIVESGIHLPNVNTIFVDCANKFGIADLHQLRGRVGRSKQQGYCYFLLDENEEISTEAKKRLFALQNNSFLGSGALLAYHDLEIRGGGNILGEAQSGHIEAIGYSLYLKMLENEINRSLSLKSENFSDDEMKSVDIKLSINAFLNSELISQDRLRLELYRRLSKCQNTSEVYEISAEIEDRFGKLDIYTKQFLDLIMIKILAKNNKIKAISNFEQNISLTYFDGSKEIIKAKSKDENDIISQLLNFLRKNGANCK